MKERHGPRETHVTYLPPGYAEGVDGRHSVHAQSAAIESDQAVDATPPARGYQRLWRAVLLQQIQDAKSQSRDEERHFDRHTARHWIFENRRDFAIVCELAGLDPDYVRRRIDAAAAREFHWRGEYTKRREGDMVARRSSITHRPKSRNARARWLQLAMEF